MSDMADPVGSADAGATSARGRSRTRAVLFDVSNSSRRRQRSAASKTKARGSGPRRSARLSGEGTAPVAVPSKEEAPLTRAVSQRPSKSTGVAARAKTTKTGKGNGAATKKSQKQQQKSSKRGKKRRASRESATQAISGSMLVHSNKRQRLYSPDSSIVPSSQCYTGPQETNYTMVCLPFDSCKYTRGLSLTDTACKGDVLQAPDYVVDIFQRLYHLETSTRPHPYMDRQHEINASMRMILVDWLVEVHTKFKLEHATLYLCINIVDRYLSIAMIERSKLQLVGVTAMLLASKYEEIYPPLIKDCIYITDRAYSHQDVLDTESHILFILGFQLSAPTAFPFMQRFLFILDASPTMKIAAQYYMDRILLEHDMLNFRPSVLAAAAVCLAVNHPGVRWCDSVSGDGPGIPEALLRYTGFSKQLIEEAACLVVDKVCNDVVTVSRRELIAVQKKYDTPRYQYISTELDPPDVNDLGIGDNKS